MRGDAKEARGEISWSGMHLSKEETLLVVWLVMDRGQVSSTLIGHYDDIRGSLLFRQSRQPFDVNCACRV